MIDGLKNIEKDSVYLRIQNIIPLTLSNYRKSIVTKVFEIHELTDETGDQERLGHLGPH